MKKVFLFAAVAAMALGFTACSDDDGEGGGGTSVANDGKISGRLTIVEEDDDYNYVSKGFVTNQVDELDVRVNYDYSVTDYLDGIEVSNGEFSFILPTPSSLLNIEDYFDYEYGSSFAEKLTINDKNAKIDGAWISYYSYKNGDSNGYGDRMSLSYSYDDPWYVYTDRDVKITGSFEEKETEDGVTYTYKYQFNVDLKKGWNSIVEAWSGSGNTGTVKITANNEPSSIVWAIELYNNLYSASNAEASKAMKSNRTKGFSKGFPKK